MDYPQDFRAESRAKVEAAIIRAGRQFDFKKSKAKRRSEIEALFWTYVLTPFVLFAMESSRLGLWQADEMDGKCREFLRLLTIDAYYRKGKAAGLSDMISNWNGGILWEAQQKIEKTPQWRRYENIRLKFAVKGRTGTQSTGIIPGQSAGLTAGDREKLRLSPGSAEVPGNPCFPDLWPKPEANQTEPSRVQSKANSGQTVESQPAKAAVRRPTQKGSESQRGAQVISQAVELGQGGVKFMRQGEFTVALPCGTGAGIFESSTITAVRVSYDILSVELLKVYSIVKAKRGEMDSAKLRKQFRSSPLAGVADGYDWNDWAEGFSPKNSQRGRPKGAALTFLERKMGLERGTIKSYLSRSKKPPPRGK